MVDTHLPVFEGRALQWWRVQSKDRPLVEYGGTSGSSDAAAQLHRSPLHILDQSGDAVLRGHLTRGDSADFSVARELRDCGYTDYLAMIQRFDSESVVGGTDCIYSS